MKLTHTTRRGFLAAAAGSLIGGHLLGQDLVYQCPMDPDVRSNVPGVCPRCGMTLRAGIPEPTEFPMDMKITPTSLKAGQKAQIEFSVMDPQNNKLVQHFQLVHEKLFHMFVISQDMQYFLHDHPVFGEDGKFRFDITFPRPGMQRVLGDFFPDGATPQLSAKTIIVGGGSQSTPSLGRDYSPKNAGNMQVSIETAPAQPNPDSKTILLYKLDPADGLEKYIGAWGHMLAASNDLIDLIHTHPVIADGGPEMQFNLYFPRAQTYRVWTQFQRRGVVNTAYFDIPVKELG
jgi:hypothetical protein